MNIKNIDSLDWHEFFIGMCVFVSKKSKDRSTKLGAVIVGSNNEVLSIGYNGFPRGVDDSVEEFHERPLKYSITEHAERNSIYNAARQGIKLDGATMYLPFYPTPCSDCARAVIQSGIKRIIGTDFQFTGKGKLWDESLKNANIMLDYAGIERIAISVGEELDIRNLYDNN